MPLIDLIYCSITVRSLEEGTLLAMIEIHSISRQMNSACIVDLMCLRWLLIRLIWLPASFMITLERYLDRGMIACFLEDLFIVLWIFFGWWGLTRETLWISMIFLLGSAGNAFLIFRILATFAVTCANDLVIWELVLLFEHFLVASSWVLVKHSRRGGGILLIGLLWCVILERREVCF